MYECFCVFTYACMYVCMYVCMYCPGDVPGLRLSASRSGGPVCDERRQSAALVCVQTAFGVLPPQGLRSIK